MEPLKLKMQGIVKEFPGVKALDGVDFEVRQSEVHALLGINGAGKSTLLSVVTNAKPKIAPYPFTTLVPNLGVAVLDVSGHEIMTSDKVTLRMNSVITYRVVDALKSVSVVDDSKQAVYRKAQLALRAVVGTFDLDTLLSDKEKVAEDLEGTIKDRAAAFGIDVLSIGIQDIILPGDMKDMMNKVIEAQKAADANLIMRREETAAMRSQANTAKLLDSNPTLMRLRELDVLEKIAGNSKLNVVLGKRDLLTEL